MAETLHASLVRIGDRTLDRRRGTLQRGGEIIPIRAKTFALLNHLADHRGRVVSTDELLAAIWPDVVVSEDSLTQCVRDLRKVLGDERQYWLRTVSRRGYLLTEDEPPEAQANPQTAMSDMLIERGLVVAVLPFGTGGDLDPVLVDGIIEEITHGLARFKTVTIVAGASALSFPVADRPPLQAIGETLGADYLVEGTFRRTAAGYRISVSLTHASTARQIWSEQFVCSEEHLLDIDMVIARRIISRLVSNIEDSVLRRNVGALSSHLKAFEHFARGRMLLRGYGRENNISAREHLSQALDIDPEFGLAHAYLALAEIIIADYGAAPRHVLEQARDRTMKALMLAPEDARCHRIMALVYFYLRDHAAAESYLNRALDLNPYDADILAQLGFILAMRGRAAAGVPLIERSIALNPLRPPWYDADLALALYCLGQYAEAIGALSAVPDTSIFHEASLSAFHAMAGNMAKAAFHVTRALEAAGDADLFDYLRVATEFEHEQDLQHFLDGVRLAVAALQSQP